MKCSLPSIHCLLSHQLNPVCKSSSLSQLSENKSPNRWPLILRKSDRNLLLFAINYSNSVYVLIPDTSSTQVGWARLATAVVPVGHDHVAYHRFVLSSPQRTRQNGSAGRHTRVGLQVQHDRVLHCVGLWRVLLDVSTSHNNKTISASTM